MAFSTRVSMVWVSSPSPIAPAMRALPLSVWSARCIARAGSKFAGVARQALRSAPTWGTSSLASSRNTGSSCASISSPSRRWRRFSGEAPGAVTADSASGAATTSGASASGDASLAASPVMAPSRAISTNALPGTARSRTPAYIIFRAWTLSLARTSSSADISVARFLSRRNAFSKAAPRSCIPLSCTVPQIPASVCAARTSSSRTPSVRPAAAWASSRSIVSRCWRASFANTANSEAEIARPPMRTTSSCDWGRAASATNSGSGAALRFTHSAISTMGCGSGWGCPACSRATQSENAPCANPMSSNRLSFAARSSCCHRFITCSTDQAASPSRSSPTIRPLPLRVWNPRRIVVSSPGLDGWARLTARLCPIDSSTLTASSRKMPSNSWSIVSSLSPLSRWASAEGASIGGVMSMAGSSGFSGSGTAATSRGASARMGCMAALKSAFP